jgi:hypothetical protein
MSDPTPDTDLHPCEPAAQPNAPQDNCVDLPMESAPPPAAPKRRECKPTWACSCPTPPTASADCLDDLIRTQDTEVKRAEGAQAFRDELKAIQDKAKAAKLDYTQAKYQGLLAQWKEQDGRIGRLIDTIVCAFPCWRCMVECSVCKLIDVIRDNERRLNGRFLPFAPPPQPPCYTEADSLYDLQYWYERKTARLQAQFDRIKSVLAAWEKPVQTIEKALADDDALIKAIGDKFGKPDAAEIIYDLFFVLVPRHLAIAPPRTSDEKTQTEIERQYADLICCRDDKAENCCDEGYPDDCCGPDTGPLSLRERLVGGPLPYLLDADGFTKVICCLVEHRYVPARAYLAEAQAELAGAQLDVKNASAVIQDNTKSLEKDAKANLVDFICDPSDNSRTGCGDKPPAAAPATTTHS